MNFVTHPEDYGGCSVSCQLTLTWTVHMNGELKSRLIDRHLPTRVEQLVNY
jgi:hypothetical protein